MKKNTIALSLTVMGMLGCKNIKPTQSDFITPDVKKGDTALVLGKMHRGDYYTDCRSFLLVNKNGQVFTVSKHVSEDSYNNTNDFSNIGDTVITATCRGGNVDIVRNLTMENKIKALTKQR